MRSGVLVVLALFAALLCGCASSASNTRPGMVGVVEYLEPEEFEPPAMDDGEYEPPREYFDTPRKEGEFELTLFVVNCKSDRNASVTFSLAVTSEGGNVAIWNREKITFAVPLSDMMSGEIDEETATEGVRLAVVRINQRVCKIDVSTGEGVGAISAVDFQGRTSDLWAVVIIDGAVLMRRHGAQ